MAEQREFKIGVLAGDGIEPEITDATVEALHAAHRADRTAPDALSGRKIFFEWAPLRSPASATDY